MSRETMTAAAATLPRAPLFGVGSFPCGAADFEFEIGWAEFERDTDWAELVLRDAGLRGADQVLVTAQNWEAPWLSPVVHALRRIGATYMCAEVWGFDARRTSMFLQRLPIRAVVGITAETVKALKEQEPPLTDLLSNVEMVWARPDALNELSHASAQVLPFVPLGPTLAMGSPGHTGAIVNDQEWEVDTHDGELCVTNLRERAATFDRTPTGVRGSVRAATNGSVAIDLG
ncbi:hypothetical protein ACRU44_07840 [Mycobacterium colombiense]